MGENKNDSAVLAPQRVPDSIVVFYVTQEAGLPTTIQGLDHTVVPINVYSPVGLLIQKSALRVTFPTKQSTKELVGLVAFGSDPRCHFILHDSNACQVHCKVWAQLNSGPNIWIIDDSSTLGTQVVDEESLHGGVVKIVRGRRQASKGLRSITIGSSTFNFLSPISEVELQDGKDWFRCNPPVLVTKAMLDQQVGQDRYDLCRMSSNPIGEGANGKVYKYMERNTALFFAVKEEQTESKEHKAMVLKEISFMHRLRHPYLVDILFDESDNKPLPMLFTAMPLYLGHLGSNLPLPNMPMTERVMLQIAEGLQFMHSNLILHRDLKPENVLVVSPGNIKIGDYGWATSLRDTDSLYGLCGTIAYCAPETLTSNEIHTPALDVYSLGAIFYSLLDLDKVQRGWVVRLFRRRKEMFNTTFENASKNPPQRFPGLVQSMLAPNPSGRCSLDKCIEIVKAQKHDWTKQTDLTPVATVTPPATGQLGIQRTPNATVLQHTPFGRNGAKANKHRVNLLAQATRPENFRSPREGPIKMDYTSWRPMLQRLEPAVLAPQAVPKQNSSKAVHVQGVNFNAGLPSYEEATSQNPFAVKPYKGNKDKKASRPKSKPNGHGTREPPVQRAHVSAAHQATKEKSRRHDVSSIVTAGPVASNRGRQPQDSRPLVRRSHQHAVNMHRAQDAGVHRRRKQLDRQAARNRRRDKLKNGVCDVARGYWRITSALVGFACDGLVVGGERMYRMLIDGENVREAFQFTGRHVDAEAQLVASMQRHSLRTAPGHGRTASGRQRSTRPYTDEEMLDSQLMMSRRR